MEHTLPAGVVKQLHCDEQPFVASSESEGINHELFYGKNIPNKQTRKALGQWNLDCSQNIKKASVAPCGGRR